MRILVTGAFGNIGKLLINELIKQKYSVRCLVLPSVKNKKIAQKIQRVKNIDVFYGDIRKIKDVKKVVSNCDVVIHLAFASPEVCEKNLSLHIK